MPVMRTGLVALTLCVGSCSAQGVEIMISIDTDLRAGSEIDQLSLQIERAQGAVLAKQAELSWDIVGRALPATIGLLPRDGPDDRPVHITLRARLQERDVVVRHAVLPFARQRVLLLRMNLLRRCVGVACGADRTCTEAGCQPRLLAPSDLPEYTEDAARMSVFDGRAPSVDARVIDARRLDAQTDTRAAVDRGGDRAAPGDGTVAKDGNVSVGSLCMAPTHYPLNSSGVLTMTGAVGPPAAGQAPFFVGATPAIKVWELTGPSWREAFVSPGLTPAGIGQGMAAGFDAAGVYHAVFTTPSGILHMHKPIGMDGWTEKFPVTFTVPALTHHALAMSTQHRVWLAAMPGAAEVRLLDTGAPGDYSANAVWTRALITCVPAASDRWIDVGTGAGQVAAVFACVDTVMAIRANVAGNPSPTQNIPLPGVAAAATAVDETSGTSHLVAVVPGAAPVLRHYSSSAASATFTLVRSVALPPLTKAALSIDVRTSKLMAFVTGEQGGSSAGYLIDLAAKVTDQPISKTPIVPIGRAYLQMVGTKAHMFMHRGTELLYSVCQ